VLTADLVNARRRGTDLHISKLDAAARARAVMLGADLVALFQASVGQAREELEAALAALDVLPREARLKDGLIKLLEDRATWGVPGGLDPEEVRRRVFLRATAVRKELAVGQKFDRVAVLAAIATEQGANPEAVEAALFSDLRGAALLTAVEPISPAALVEMYERGQAQAVLLRAVRIHVGVECASAGAARALFRRLKFLGLLHTIAPAEKGYAIVIDGPLSLFDAVTKYGQKMALVLPVLDGCDRWTLEADVRWGKARTPLRFRASGGASGSLLRDPPLPDEIAELIRRFNDLGTAWVARPNDRILDLPGVGLSIPDLAFVRRIASTSGGGASSAAEASRQGGKSARGTGHGRVAASNEVRAEETIYFESLGFWSREAVFRRVDLVERGLGHKVLFAVSSRLRVSEEVLGENASSALYVYKGAMSARAIADKVEALAKRTGPS
jgi:predicted nuclease of restriction endonuclease-like RecB superfamily